MHWFSFKRYFIHFQSNDECEKNNMKWKSIGYSLQRWHINRQHTGRVKCCSTAPINRAYNLDLNRMKNTGKKNHVCMTSMHSLSIIYRKPREKNSNDRAEHHTFTFMHEFCVLDTLRMHWYGLCISYYMYNFALAFWQHTIFAVCYFWGICVERMGMQWCGIDARDSCIFNILYIWMKLFSLVFVSTPL